MFFSAYVSSIFNRKCNTVITNIDNSRTENRKPKTQCVVNQTVLDLLLN